MRIWIFLIQKVEFFQKMYVFRGCAFSCNDIGEMTRHVDTRVKRGGTPPEHVPKNYY